MIKNPWRDQRAELDEKVFLIGLFVVAAALGLAAITQAVSSIWTNALSVF